jgi:hypothetical protein
MEHVIYNDYGLCHMKKIYKKNPTHTDLIYCFAHETRNTQFVLYGPENLAVIYIGQNQIIL